MFNRLATYPRQRRYRLLIVVNDLQYFFSHRLPIAQAAQKYGLEVHVAFGDFGGESQDTLSARGLTSHFVPIRRGGMNPLVDLCSAFALWRLFRRLQPDLVHLITIKPVLYGGISARLARVPAIVAAMAGLGFIFTTQVGLRILVLRRLIGVLFRLALDHSCKRLIFQNADDRDQILAMTGGRLQETRLIRGSGVHLAACPLQPESNGKPIVVMASRLLRDKGVLEFVAASRILRKRRVSAQFWLVGEPDLANPASVSPQEVEVWKSEGILECLGHRLDVPSLYAKAHIVVLPSYREGLPKSLIEAAACGRPIVTTNVPGCRDAIEPGVSGLLVPPRDPVALADAIQRLTEDPALRQSMGSAGRTLAEREFGIEKVVATHLEIYKELLDKCA
jgi:glycosyltransferase involved in cell wall biosynthesis